MPFPRSSGILLHPTSFPSRFGVGDLGPNAYHFINFLAETSQQIWQVLPLGPTGHGNSPYMCYSAIAGNPLLISPEKLREKDLLSYQDLENLPEFPEDHVDYDRAIHTKMELLWKAYENFQTKPQEAFVEFCEKKQEWLDDYALFMSLKKMNRGMAWNTWDKAIVQRDPITLEACYKCLKTEVIFQKYLQFEFFNQWSELKKYANDRGIEIIGDIPIYVAHDSVDVWSNPEIFCLDQKSSNPAGIAGVPPDYFSETGQLWGNPVYLWKKLKERNFDWWIKRFEALLEYVDIIRIDHFRGFESFWQVKMGESNAIKGKWVKVPGEEFFNVVNEKLGKLPIVAEDLGIITPEVEELRDKFEFPGMKVLHFAFGSGSGNGYLPFNYYSRNCIVYTGTHDNDTTVGWFEKLSDNERAGLLAYLGTDPSPDGIHWDLIRLALSSVANQAIIPLQDVLGLGSEARMNVPGKADGNWGWRYRHNALTDEAKMLLKKMTNTYGRDRQ